MILKNLSPEQLGMLKGGSITFGVLATGVAIGLFFLKRRHEDELDKLEIDTVSDCLNFATKYYEQVIRRYKEAVENIPLTLSQEEPNATGLQ